MGSGLRTALCAALCAGPLVGLPARLRAEPDRSLLPADVRVTREQRGAGEGALDFVVIDVAHKGDRVVLRYPGFDVSQSEGVQFVQAGPDAQLLNRIESAKPSFINGRIESNGQVAFVNPAGVLFGPNAVVEASSIFAAAGELSEADFLDGRLRVDPSGLVENYGTLHARGGGAQPPQIALIGRAIHNSGALLAPGGRIVVLSAEQGYLLEPDSEVLIALPVPRALRPDAAAAAGAPAEAPLAASDAYAFAVQTQEGGAEEPQPQPEPPAALFGDIHLGGVLEGRVDAVAKNSSVTIEVPDAELRVGRIDAQRDATLTARSIEIGDGIATQINGIRLAGDVTLSAEHAVLAAGQQDLDQLSTLQISGSVTHHSERGGSLLLSAAQEIQIDGGTREAVVIRSSGDVRFQAPQLRVQPTAGAALELSSAGVLELPALVNVEGDAQLQAGGPVRAETLLVRGALSLEAGGALQFVRAKALEAPDAGIAAREVQLRASEVTGLEQARLYTLSGAIDVNGEAVRAVRAGSDKALQLRILGRISTGQWEVLDPAAVQDPTVRKDPRALMQPILDLEAAALELPSESEAIPGLPRCPSSGALPAAAEGPGASSGAAPVEPCSAAAALERARQSYLALVANLAQIRRGLQDEARACRRSSDDASALDGAQLAACLREHPTSLAPWEHLRAVGELLSALADVPELSEAERSQTAQRVLSRIVPEEMTVSALIEAVQLVAFPRQVGELDRALSTPQ